ncbi:acetylcholine receptor subunit beta-like 1 isoform X6 [Lingula anatina]|uniref:Acetylcholine receptor subunit beta-like 1 isoform X6 n=1 Tax=Lingula anatina TaxID=7574 RepID=A0A1S3J929_LINAN|nr:acetylcholine receptor subunit beta-like 1 isoform X6 [Lingula anatina]|eukprot:XP_013406818.1 acetylcholine receptor subunit beta-like 1 isoform X6 [Lingula anatina]
MTRSCIGLYFVYVILTSIRIQCFVSRTGLGSEDESKLVEDLFDKTGYNPLIRPVQNLSDKLMINFGLTMIQLINVDEKNQIMKTNVWLQTVWYDYQLVWDPADYGGISSIRVPMDKVWTPDIVLFNNADGNYQVSYKSNVVIYYDGTLLHVPPAIYKSTCHMDVQYFPFDEQDCPMTLGSWTFSGEQLGFHWYESEGQVYSTLDLSDYMPSGTWDIIKGPGEIIHIPAQDGKQTLTRAIYTVRIKRKTLFYTVNLIIPCVLISFLSVCTFFLPTDAGEKITLCVSLLISLVVFILLISKMLPPTSSSIPLIAKFLLFTFIMNIVSIFTTVIIINWHYRSPRSHRMNMWVRILFLNYLPRLLLMKRPDHYGQYMRGLKKREEKRKQKERNIRDIKLTSSSDRRETESAYQDRSGPDTKREVLGAIENTDFISQHVRDRVDHSYVLKDWKYVAMVIDRLLLYIFLLVNIGGTVGIFFNAKTIFDIGSDSK